MISFDYQDSMKEIGSVKRAWRHHISVAHVKKKKTRKPTETETEAQADGDKHKLTGTVHAAEKTKVIQKSAIPLKYR